MAEVLHLTPACGACPVVRFLGVLCACRVEVSIGLLCRCNDTQYTIDIEFQLLVGVGLQDVAGSLDGLVGVGVIKRESSAVYLEELGRVLHALGSVGEVGISPLALALAESQRYGHLTACLEALAPEAFVLNLYRSEGHGGDGVTPSLFSFFRASREGYNRCQCSKNDFLHDVIILYDMRR